MSDFTVASSSWHEACMRWMGHLPPASGPLHYVHQQGPGHSCRVAPHHTGCAASPDGRHPNKTDVHVPFIPWWCRWRRPCRSQARRCVAARHRGPGTQAVPATSLSHQDGLDVWGLITVRCPLGAGERPRPQGTRSSHVTNHKDASPAKLQTVTLATLSRRVQALSLA